MKTKMDYVASFAVNLLVLVLTLALAVLFYQKADPKVITNIALTLIIVGFLIVFLIYLNFFRLDIKEIRKQNRSIDVLEAVPHLFAFNSRHDKYIVLENGDGRLNWTFQIEKITEKPIAKIEFPIFCEKLREVTERDPYKPSIKIEKLVVDRVECTQDAVYIPKILRVPIGDSKSKYRIAEQGSILVPVSLLDGKSRVNVSMSIYMEGIF